ncbi:hypothetical protein [Tardiphaga sp. 862_B3_N1_1]|uniref:hypothetical protein n=1 Tax=Tardiphaga sp. 862_B3_N1_1 TaxID=3240763 RepID=UPI003F8BFF49
MTNIAHHNLLETAKHHREQAEAYEALAQQLQRVHAAAEPAPIRDIAESLSKLGLCIVHRAVLLKVLDCVDPQDDDMHPRDLEDNQIASATALRKILHPNPASEPNRELPL